MAIFVCSLNSGSNGNCYYIGNEQEAVLVDAGLSCRETEKRMKHLGLSLAKVKAIFISHEHTDHIKGLQVLSAKYRLPVYITTATLRSGYTNIDSTLVRSFVANEAVEIGTLSITPFQKIHDACDPYSFTISCGGVNVGVFTDIGVACERLIRNFRICHAAFLEANYDDDMLDKGSYPYHLKKRIRGGKGHLSNKQALEVFTRHRQSFMTHLFLAHLSKNNNCPKLVQELFNRHADGVQTIIASRNEPTAVYRIESTVLPPRVVGVTQMSFAFV